jgi:aminoglycoside 2'-N-acetyltransferase I
METPRLRRLTTPELTVAETAAIRTIMDEAFGSDDDERFTDDDWEHALGGVHVVLDVAGVIVTHAAVVERLIRIGDRPLKTGYVEAVATAPASQGAGFGTLVMTDVTALIRARYELGCLGTGLHDFYERLGWRTWRGPSSVLTAAGPEPTADDDGYLMVVRTPASPSLDFTAPIACEWRRGDVW